MVSMCTKKGLDRCVKVSLSQFNNHVYSHACMLITSANKESLVVDYNFLANEQHVQVIAFFLPEAPSEMLNIFDEVCIHELNMCSS